MSSVNCVKRLICILTVSSAMSVVGAQESSPEEKVPVAVNNSEEISDKATSLVQQNEFKENSVPTTIVETDSETKLDKVSTLSAGEQKAIGSEETPASSPGGGQAPVKDPDMEISPVTFTSEEQKKIDVLLSKAEVFLYGDGVPVNLERAAQLYAEAADIGSPKAKLRLSTMYRQGQGVEKNPKKAFTLLLDASKANYAPAQAALSSFYKRGLGTERDEAKSKFWLSKAAENGNHISKVLYSTLLQQTNAEAGQVQLAKQYLNEVKEDATPQELYSIAYSFAHGLLLPEDNAKAMEWAEAAAKKGQVHAMYLLGECYWKEKDYKQAAFWFEKAAEKGLVAAQLQTGRLYRDGTPDVKPDISKAVKWLEKSANSGAKEDIYSLLILLETGPRSIRDHKKAQQWLNYYLEKASPDELINLSHKYWDGESVRRNFNLGGAFALGALKKGDEKDVCYFAQMLGTRNWKNADFVTAYSLLNKCVIDNPEDKKLKEEFEQLQEMMSADQVQEAQDLDPSDALKDYLSKNQPKLD